MNSRMGNYAVAESLFRWNLALRGEILGEDDTSLATTYNNMATLLQTQGRIAEAEAAYAEALERWERRGRGGHPVAAATLNNLAIVRGDSLEEALQRNDHLFDTISSGLCSSTCCAW